jgi:hypothetical protein
MADDFYQPQSAQQLQIVLHGSLRHVYTDLRSSSALRSELRHERLRFSGKLFQEGCGRIGFGHTRSSLISWRVMATAAYPQATSRSYSTFSDHRLVSERGILSDRTPPTRKRRSLVAFGQGGVDAGQWDGHTSQCSSSPPRRGWRGWR